MKITAPGVYALSSEDYHADPAPEPSLSAGMINELLVAPAKCWENSRRLNPDWEEPEKPEKFSIGSVAHIMHLEPHLFEERVAIVQGKTKDGKLSDGYATQDAKDQRDAALAAGKTPILAKHMTKVLAARAKFQAHGFTSKAFVGGKFEQSMFWRHPLYGFWCRARPDFIHDTIAHLNDYKATANADPTQFGRHAYNMGYHRRAAWYLEGAEILFGKRPDHYWFCNQETKAPYLTAVVELDWQALEDGKAENDHAAGIFYRCMESGDWYGYRHSDALDRDRAFQIPLPPYASAQIDERLRRDSRAWPSAVNARDLVQEEIE